MSKTNQPEINRIYSFNELKSEHGVVKSFAFRLKNQVTALLIHREMNPSVQDYLTANELNILVANGKTNRESTADRLDFQRSYPVYLFVAKNEWRYIGNYWFIENVFNPISKALFLKGQDKTLSEIAVVIRLSKVSKAQIAALKIAS